ncbi:MAG TPA: LpqB family beta-propeller domain-containing protein [Gemmatimonadales bacterium]|nr:LpqB family beta-propeller domain-containing protein [Gemmatimonadales bacterium]
MNRSRPLASWFGLVAVLCLFTIPADSGLTADRALWLRYPAISPDGKTIAFEYRGNLWKVSSEGGVATPLTVGESYNSMPVWSPDGGKIAFASDRNGNLDVYVMPSGGGRATRLTYHSADEIPTSFTPNGKSVLFSASIMHSATSAGFPTAARPELYRVDLDGHMPVQVLTTTALYAVYDHDMKRLLYSDQRGYEMEWRKHDHSSFARDVWIEDVATSKFTRLTGYGYDDRQPVWGADEHSIFYLSEKSGSFNVWTMKLSDPEHPTQLTAHTGGPVRFLSASRAGDLCYAYDGELWVRPAGASDSRRLAVSTEADDAGRAVKPTDVSSQITEFDVSPDGSEVAFIARGEVFVASTEHGDTRRITNTPEQERSVSFSPDGRTLLYAAERGQSWKIFRTDLTDKNEPNFFNATGFKETPVVEGSAEEFQPSFSPDGREIAYLEERTTLKVLDLATGKSRVVLPGKMNYSYEDGDQAYAWSPDGRWLAVQFLSPGRWSNEVGVVSAAGDQKVINITQSGYEDEDPRWSRKGEVLYWRTDRQGLRTQSGNGRESDVYAAYLTHGAWDRYQLDPASYDQLIAKEKESEKDQSGSKDAARDKSARPAQQGPKPAEAVTMDFDHVEDRVARLSFSSSDLGDAALSGDGEDLYFMARYDKGYDLWKYVPRKKEIKQVAAFGAQHSELKLGAKGKKAFVLHDGKLAVVDLDSGKMSPVGLSARMDLDPAQERAYMFEHIWRQTLEKFLDTKMHGVDWQAMKTEYGRFLPYIDNDRDFAELCSEMQGELNASHTGCRYRPTRTDGDETAALGFFPDPRHTGPGIGVLDVLEGGPLQKSGTKIRAGVVITAMDGAPIAAGDNWYRLLNRKAGTPVRLSLFDPHGSARWDETVKPITWAEQSLLLYKRWARANYDQVVKLSGGRLGYAHIRGMSDGPYREVFQDIFGRDTGKDAIVLDTRFNGGGNLDEALTTFLSGRVFMRSVPRGQYLGDDPSNRWTKPSIVVMNEGNYSDAHCFPTAYTELGLGQTVGMPVPGTCSSVWWERLQDPDLVFGIPEVAIYDIAGDVLENKQLDPTYLVVPDPAQEAAGHDQQLEKAVEVLLDKVAKK